MEEYSIEGIQRIDKHLLIAFINAANQLNLNYYLMGGTMLGAVRHQGFIPWDDDIDVGMLREDYETFLTKAPALLPEYYFLQSWKSDPGYPRVSAKLRDSRTTFVEYNVKEKPINHGVYIDIFPLDYYPDKVIKQLLFDFRDICLKARTLKEFTIPEEKRRSPTAEFLIKILQSIMQIKYPTLKDTMEARDRLYMSVRKSRLIANHGGYWRKKEIVPAEWYGEGARSTFEGVDVILPTQYKKWLQQVYGDYMQLPPVEKRVTHHDLAVIDLNNSYTMYMNQYRSES